MVALLRKQRSKLDYGLGITTRHFVYAMRSCQYYRFVVFSPAEWNIRRKNKQTNEYVEKNRSEDGGAPSEVNEVWINKWILL